MIDPSSKADRRALEYVRQHYPVSLESWQDSPWVLEIRLQFIRGWDCAASADQELDNIAIQVLSKKALDRRRGGCF